MKALWRRLFGRKDELDDATTAYIEGRASPAEVDAVRRELDVSPEGGREIEELRQTVDLMRSVETPPAPRSFALTPDMVPEQRAPLRLDLSYAPAAAAAVLVLAVGVLMAGDLADLLKQSESGGVDSMSAPSQIADSERVVRGQSVQPEAGKSVAEKAADQKAVVVEKPVTHTEKVVETVTVEKQVTRTEKVVETVVVEKQVTAVEKVVEGKTVTVVETVVVEKPVTRTETVVETVTVEKTTAMRAVHESDEATAKKEAPPDETPVAEAAAAAKSMADETEQASHRPQRHWPADCRADHATYSDTRADCRANRAHWRHPCRLSSQPRNLQRHRLPSQPRNPRRRSSQRRDPQLLPYRSSSRRPGRFFWRIQMRRSQLKSKMIQEFRCRSGNLRSYWPCWRG